MTAIQLSIVSGGAVHLFLRVSWDGLALSMEPLRRNRDAGLARLSCRCTDGGATTSRRINVPKLSSSGKRDVNRLSDISVRPSKACSYDQSYT
jgi:hypothetical protein